MNSLKGRFTKVLDEDFSSRLEISKTDLEGLKGEKSKFIYLIGPVSNRLRKIRVKSGRNSFLLKLGWKKFVKENKLQRNDALYFSFKEHGIFNVAIFDKFGRRIRERRSAELINGEERGREAESGREIVELINGGETERVREAENGREGVELINGEERRKEAENGRESVELINGEERERQTETRASERVRKIENGREGVELINGEERERGRVRETESGRQRVDMINGKERERERERGREAANGRERIELNTRPLCNIGETGGPSREIGKKRASEPECSHRHPKRGRVEEQTIATERDIPDVSSDVGSCVGNTARDKGKQIVEESSETEESDSLSVIDIESSESDSLNEIQKKPPGIISLSSSSSRSLKPRAEPPSVKKEVESFEDSDSEAESSEESDSDSEIGRKKARKIPPKSRSILKSTSRKVNDREREMTKRQAENKLESNDHTFMKVIDTKNAYISSLHSRKNNAYKYYLNVPIEFGRRNFPTKSTHVTLRLAENEKEWEVHCKYTLSVSETMKKTNTQWRFSTGWNDFFVENNLEDGDMCVFELKREKCNREKIELIVHIFRF